MKREVVPTEFPSGAKLPYVRSKESEQSIISKKSEFSLRVNSFIITYMQKFSMLIGREHVILSQTVQKVEIKCRKL